MTPTDVPPTPTTTPTAAEVWLAETLGLLDSILNSTAAYRLRDIAAKPPIDDLPTLERATAAILERLGLTRTPEAERRTAVENLVTYRVSALLAVQSIQSVLHYLADRGDALRAQAAGTAEDPIIRLADFHGDTLGTLRGVLLVSPNLLPPSHPARQIECVRSPRGPALLLGDPRADPAWFRLSDVRRLTAEAIAHANFERQAEERRQNAKVEQARAAWLASPDGQLARIRELEGQVAAARGTPPTAQTPG